ncbi:MAG: GTP-binding protein [Oscillospiraceae bacterium]|jgi:ribosomal protection tetracycline resistance protein
MNKTIGILAHVDAGKTTLSEQILHHCGALRKAGRVDHKDTFLDFNPIEQARGITIFSEQASFSYGETRYFLVDTPGHVDFSPEMERAVGVLDYAILVVSCTSGVQAHTETIWRLLEQQQIPVFFFLNKIDGLGADVNRTLDDIRAKLTGDVCCFDAGLTDTVTEQIAMTDEAALEQFLEQTGDETFWYQTVRRAVQKRALFPAFSGSALNDVGVDAFLAGLDRMTETTYDETQPFRAKVYKIRHDAQNNRTAYLKVLSGMLHAKDRIAGEKTNELRLYEGKKYTTVQTVSAGQLCAVTGLQTVQSGDTIGETIEHRDMTLIPLLSAKVTCENAPVSRVLPLLRILEDEEPSLHLRWEETLQEIHLSVMGEIQLEVLKETAKQRFDLDLSFGECEVLYKETIRGAVLGSGHFEPLRHYAEVHLKLEQGPKNSGITYASACPTDYLSTNWQRLIETHIFEKEHKGVLVGAPLTDVRITLLAGRAHEKHTEGGDFRQATYRAIRHGLFHAQNVLLEPYYAFHITVQPELVGRILTDIRNMSGTTEPPEPIGAYSMICGRCPVSEMMRYSRSFAAMTHGRGSMVVTFDGYEVCHDTQVVLDRIQYDREHDTDNTPDSVFCSHGAGFTVKWYESARYMHCLW